MPDSTPPSPITPAQFDHPHFVRTLRMAMARKDFSQADLADAIEARTGNRPAQTTISYWLRRDDKVKAPTVRVLPALVDSLDLSWEELFPPATTPRSQTPPSASPRTAPVRVSYYRLKQGRLVRTRRTMRFDGRAAGDLPLEHLGGILVPAGWDNMIRYVRPGDQLLVERFDPPRSLAKTFKEGAYTNGVYLVSFSGGLQLHRLQELPGSIITVLSDNEAYRDVRLSLDAGDDLQLHARCLSAEGPR